MKTQYFTITIDSLKSINNKAHFGSRNTVYTVGNICYIAAVIVVDTTLNIGEQIAVLPYASRPDYMQALVDPDKSIILTLQVRSMNTDFNITNGTTIRIGSCYIRTL